MKQIGHADLFKFMTSLCSLILQVMFVAHMTIETYPGLHSESSALLSAFLPLLALSCIPLYMLYTYFYNSTKIYEETYQTLEDDVSDKYDDKMLAVK